MYSSALLTLVSASVLVAPSFGQITYRFDGTVSDNTPDPTIAGIFDGVAVGASFSVIYEVDPNAPSMMGAPSWNLFADPVTSLTLEVGGVTSTELLGSEIRIEDNVSNPLFQCLDATTFSSTAASYTTLDVILRTHANGPPCPNVTQSFDLPTALDLSDYFMPFVFVTGPGAATLRGDITSVTISSVPFGETCNGDGGNQMGCTDCPCGNSAAPGTSGGCLNSAGTSARLARSGSSSVSSADLRFDASGIAPGVTSILTSGNALAPTNAANPCFGMNSGVQSVNLDGLRCVVQGVLRHGARVADANGAIGAMTNGWGTPDSFFNFAAFVAGGTKHFQLIYRDDANTVCQTGQNSSQAISITFVN